MSDRIVLRVRGVLEQPLDLESVAPDRLVSLSQAEIAALPVWYGRMPARLGDFFDVDGEHAATVHLQGTTALVDGLGTKMAGGELFVDGDAGRRFVAGMSGGRVELRGSAGDDAAVGMSGGVLRISGRAGDRLAAASTGAASGMSGGEVVVDGDVGAEAAASCRRGLVVVAGRVGPRAARGMIAGSLVVFGAIGDDAGRFLKRGTIVALGGVEVPDTYRYACTYRPPHLRVTMTYLLKRYGLPVNSEMVAGRYRRYCGDLVPPAKGELLVWAAPADAAAG